MRAPPLPSNEAQRLDDLHEYGILDTGSERIFDEIAELASAICGTPYAAVSLIDRDRQWFKAAYGMSARQLPREDGVCGHAILARELFEVQDTDKDERFSNNPALSGSPKIRFYGGSQLNSDRGNTIGMLCVLDSVPRKLTAAQRLSLKQLADVLMAVLEAARQSRQLNWFSALVDEVSDEIFISDPLTLRYLYANASALRSLGYTLERLRQMTPMDVTKDQNRQKFEGYVEQLRSGVPYVIFEGVRQRINGEPYPVEVRWQLLTTRGREVILSFVHDIAQRKEVERMKNEFISVVNHELRTPLTSIHGAVKLLEQGAGGVLPPPAARLIALAAKNTERLRSIVDDILDLEKIASGRMEFDIELLDALGVLSWIAQGHESAAVTADVNLVLESPADLGLKGDAQRLHQVLTNLVSNALKFAPRGSRVLLSAEPHAAGVKLQVMDEGPGIPDDFRSLIFQRFAQADMQTSRAKGGSGLGLSIAKQMTEQMGGSIGYESAPGRTCFYVVMPRAAAS